MSDDPMDVPMASPAGDPAAAPAADPAAPPAAVPTGAAPMGDARHDAPHWPAPPLPADLVARRLAYAPERALLRPYVPATAGFRDGASSPREFLERSLDAIAAHEPSVRAFVVTDLAAARAAADRATRRWREGRPLSAIDGMPVAVKDMIETRDLPTQMNSPLFAGWHSRRDAAPVQALRQAGAVILGKTVTTEFAVGNSGPTRNPYDSARTPGGSSSGSAAAVGAGMASLALGTQTQASTIRPAGYCGAWGLKPSLGALPTGGVTPLARSLDHLGVLAAGLEDLWAGAMAMARLAGGDAPHPGLAGPDTAPAARRPRALARLDMVGWPETPASSRAAFEAAVEALARTGVPILDRRSDPGVAALEAELAAIMDYSLDLLAWEARWPLRGYLEQGMTMVGPRIQDLLARAAAMTEADYRRALARREALREAVAALSDRVEGFVTLCSSGPAIADHAFTGSRAYPTAWTLVAGPAFALPLMAAEELPLGLQLCGFRERDAELCAVAAWIRDTLCPALAPAGAQALAPAGAQAFVPAGAAVPMMAGAPAPEAVR